MKKILIISQGYWPEIFPINHIAEKLSKTHFLIDVLTGHPNYPKGHIFKGYRPQKIYSQKKNKINIHRVPVIPRGENSKIGIILNYISFILSSLFIGTFLLRKKKYDVILVYATSPIFQSYIGIFFKFIKKSPKLVTWVQDLWPNILAETGIINNKLILKILDYFVRNIYDSNDLLLAQSESFCKEIKKKTKTKIKLLYNPGNSDKFLQKKIKKKSISLLYAGNIGNAQPWNLLLNCLNNFDFKNRNVKLIICGEGQKKNFLLKFIKDKKLKNIIYKGFVVGKKLEKEYKNSDILLIMLKKGLYLNKTIPSKFQTYLSKGKPILALSDGEVGKILKKNNLGFVTRPSNEKKIKMIFNKVVNLKKGEIEKKSNNVKKFYMKNFSQKRINETLVKQLNDL